MDARREWLTARKSGIGGSDIAALMGLSPWRTALDVFEDKTTDAVNDQTSEPMYWGTVLEDVVAREYAKRTGNTVQRVGTMIRDPQRPWLLANIDRAIVAPGSRARFVEKLNRLEGANGILEVKTASAYSVKEWAGEDGSDAMPVYYAAQCMWYLGLTGQPYCDIAVLIGGSNYQRRRIEADKVTIDAMLDRATAFWHDHIVARKPPAPTTAADAARLFRKDDGTLLDVSSDADVCEKVYRLRQLAGTLADAEAEAEALKDALKLQIGAASGLKIDGDTAVTWKAAKETTRVAWADVVASIKSAIDPDNPDHAWIAHEIERAIGKSTTTLPGSRRFIVK